MLHRRSGIAPPRCRILARTLALLGVILTAAALPNFQLQRAASAASIPGQVTFNKDIAPIMFRSCAACHRPGEAAPFPLLSYADAKKHAHQIADVTRDKSMPPWLPEPQPLKFADEMRLTPGEIDLIQRWVEQGALEGNPSDMPPPPQFPEGWRLGKPDLVLQAEKPFVLQPQGTDTYWNFIFRVPITETRWVKAVEIRPGDKRYVHHANILIDRDESSRRREAQPGAGFGGMEIRIESQAFEPDSHLLFWKPGSVPSVEPEGMALQLNKGADLILNTHMQPSGKTEIIQPSLGLYFTAHPATKLPMLFQLEDDDKLDIAAGQHNFPVTDEFILPVDVNLLAIYPHAHYLGKDIEAWATLPDGTRETLIHIPHWNLSWQAVYRYAEPVLLPKGTTVNMRYVYDNSEENPLNPNHPPLRVKGGNRSSDEMCHLWLQVLPVNFDPTQGDPRRLLEESLAAHDVKNDPSNFEAHYNLAAMLQARGQLDDAVSEYEAALRLRPDDAVANNAMGAALLANGRPQQAIAFLAAAVEARPDYFDAHYNLGNALAQLANFEGALRQFRLAIQEQPKDANAEANLGSALAELGRFGEAKSHFERALKIDPNHSLARENLEEIQRTMKRQ
ncbi:MAG TPA: tetratricopeptide repeat protein [Candidatus Sulfotelmatobacter sp.]|jgi:Tfp pilus assembly protein PilF/mono/diheme cytochrome c family protein